MRTHATNRTVFGIACFCVLGLVALLSSGTPSAGAAATLPGQGFLPDNRAWEMVSPPDKNGGDVMVNSRRVRAAFDGSVASFASLVGFANVVGTGVATEYVAQRSSDPNPGNPGWSTHAITAPQEPTTAVNVALGAEARYLTEFSPNFERAIFFATSPLTDEPLVANVMNLYRRDDLHDAGVGSYSLITRCSLCESMTPPAPLSVFSFISKPEYIDSSSDFSRVIFESKLNLAPGAAGSGVKLYQWDDQTDEVSLVGILPDGSPAATSSAGGGLSSVPVLAKHTISDDGTKVFFKDAVGVTEADLFMRLEGTTTVKLNASERSVADPNGPAPARYRDATADGSRVFFTSGEALTEDAEPSAQKLYMYDTTKPDSAPDNLTLISPDEELGDGPNDVTGVIGASEDGNYVYFTASGQLVEGAPAEENGIFLWHEGALTYVSRLHPVDEEAEGNWNGGFSQLRVTRDGRHMSFGSHAFGVNDRIGPTGYDHGTCATNEGVCRELYLYSADTDELECASCNPSGAPATADATVGIRFATGGSNSSPHESRPLSDDGRYLFFSSAERLVSEDINGITDVYVYDAVAGEPRLLSSGESSLPSYFMDASASGHDAFFLTRERLSGWDIDGAFDLYDARVNGGFPEPPPAPPSCEGDACQPTPRVLADPTPASATLIGAGNVRAASRTRSRCNRARRLAKGSAARKKSVKRCGARAHTERGGHK